ncbi:MAG: hypothetical protein GX938_09405 [Spirochaetales bacterium]|nr:hypothetical protein [Spirochaetales bacterium]
MIVLYKGKLGAVFPAVVSVSCGKEFLHIVDGFERPPQFLDFSRYLLSMEVDTLSAARNAFVKWQEMKVDN